jgi:hypothetical protein
MIWGLLYVGLVLTVALVIAFLSRDSYNPWSMRLLAVLMVLVAEWFLYLSLHAK